MAKIILRNSDCIFAVSINIQTIDHVLLHKYNLKLTLFVTFCLYNILLVALRDANLLFLLNIVELKWFYSSLCFSRRLLVTLVEFMQNYQIEYDRTFQSVKAYQLYCACC